MFDGIIKTITSAAFLGTLGKGVGTAAFIIALSEIAKRSTWLAASVRPAGAVLPRGWPVLRCRWPWGWAACTSSRWPAGRCT